MARISARNRGWRDDQRVIGDRRFDDDRNAFVEQRLQPSTTSRSLPAVAAYAGQLSTHRQATRVGDLGEPEPHRVLERSVALQEIVEEITDG